MPVLICTAGTPVARLEISDVFAWDKLRYLKSVYGTARTADELADTLVKKGARRADTPRACAEGRDLVFLCVSDEQANVVEPMLKAFNKRLEEYKLIPPGSDKFAWAPLADRLPLPFLTRRLGRRRSWIRPTSWRIWSWRRPAGCFPQRFWPAGAPLWMIRPWCRSRMRSAMAKASAWSWVT